MNDKVLTLLSLAIVSSFSFVSSHDFEILLDFPLYLKEFFFHISATLKQKLIFNSPSQHVSHDVIDE